MKNPTEAAAVLGPGLFLRDRQPVLLVVQRVAAAVQDAGGWPRGPSLPGRSEEGLLENDPDPDPGWRRGWGRHRQQPGRAEQEPSSRRHLGARGLGKATLGRGLRRGPRLTWRPATEPAGLKVRRVQARGAAGRGPEGDTSERAAAAAGTTRSEGGRPRVSVAAGVRRWGIGEAAGATRGRVLPSVVGWRGRGRVELQLQRRM